MLTVGRVMEEEEKVYSQASPLYFGGVESMIGARKWSEASRDKCLVEVTAGASLE